VIAGNFIGTDATGTVRLAGTTEAVRVCNGSGCANNVIGGPAAGAGNLIAGGGTGIDLHDGSTGTVIQGNRIGTDVSGTVGLGDSGCGIRLESTGGGSMVTGNIIAFNSAAGVAIANGTGSRVTGNSIFSNGGLGITFNSRCDVLTDPTPNDSGDGDTGENGLQNFPELAAGIFPGGSSIGGTLNSTPNTTFRVEVFANDACDASGNGEGQTCVGANDSVMTDGNGDASFTVTFGQTVAAGKVLTATATAPDGSTSEFGPCTAAPPTTTTTTTTATTTTATTTTVTTTTTTTTATTTTVTTTTATTSTTSTTRTTTTTATTSTTQPADACAGAAVAPTFVSIDCRLLALIAQVQGASALGTLQPKLLDQLEKAKMHKEQAETLCRQANKRRTRNALRPAINKMTQFVRTLGSRRVRTIPQDLVGTLRTAATSIRTDMQTLEHDLRCPDDAPPA
jgi:parallel beta-helix repeat protein